MSLKTTFRDFVHSTKSLVSGKRPQKKTPILFLPDLLLQKIHDNLSLVDQACLALSCKPFFNLFSTIAEHKELAFPRLLKIKDPRKCINRKDIPRNQLLLRLETKKWLYCGACLKLHPREKFKLLTDKLLQRRCSKNAGIVDLCPCISLTGADRKKIIHILKFADVPDSTLGGRFELIHDEDMGSYLLHSCVYSATKHWKTSLSIFVGIDEDRRLVAHTMYRMCAQTYPRVNRRAEPVFACPHTDLTMLAGWFHGSRKCKYCETCSYGTARPNTNPATFEVIRVLGRCEGFEGHEGAETHKVVESHDWVDKKEGAKSHEVLKDRERLEGHEDSESLDWFQQSRFTSETWEDYMAFW
jgi:hypothetical protein